MDDYFRRQVELSSMYTFMEQHNVESAQEGIDSVRNGLANKCVSCLAVNSYECF